MIDQPQVEVHYQATWPEKLDPQLKAQAHKVSDAFWDASGIVAFPVALLRLTMHLLGDYAARQVFPGPKLTQSEIDSRGEKIIEFFGAERRKIATADDILLDAVFIKGTKRPDKVLLIANGNGSTWETSKKLLTFLQKTGASLLCVNPRGLSHSSGSKCVDKFKVDIYSAYQYLLYLGYGYKDILTYGRSLAGGYNFEALALIQAENPDEKIGGVSERSFDTLSHESDHWMRENKARFMVPALMRFAGAEIDTVKALKQLKGKSLVIFHPEDDVIPYPYSLDQAISDKDNPYIYRVEMEAFKEKNPHNRPFTENEETLILEKLRLLLEIQ